MNLPAVSGQVKCYTKTLLASFDILFVEFVAFFYSAESCILTDSPRTLGIP